MRLSALKVWSWGQCARIKSIVRLFSKQYILESYAQNCSYHVVWNPRDPKRWPGLYVDLDCSIVTRRRVTHTEEAHRCEMANSLKELSWWASSCLPLSPLNLKNVSYGQISSLSSDLCSVAQDVRAGGRYVSFLANVDDYTACTELIPASLSKNNGVEISLVPFLDNSLAIVESAAKNQC